jgi:hypothetical protein
VINPEEVWLESPKGRHHSKYIFVDGRIILKWILRKYGGRLQTGFICVRTKADSRPL